jgi:hypothetical protein
MTKYTFELPGYFDDDAAEIEAKGYFGPVSVVSSDDVFKLYFYDAVRLQQEISDALRSAPYFAEPGLVVVTAVTRAQIESAIEYLGGS